MNIDDTIREVERLYKSVTGSDVPPERETPFATIPPEVDPQRYVEAQVERLTQLLASQATLGRAPMMTRPTMGGPTTGTGGFSPPLSVFDGEKERVYRLDVPGVRREDIEVSLAGGALVIRGKRTLEPENGLRVRWRETHEGRFERVMPLPRGVGDDELRVSLKDGCLEIRVPLRADAEPITLEIQ